ncbi:hypothetical protein [Ferruginibacter sp.]
MKNLFLFLIILSWQTIKSQNIIQLWQPYTVNILPNCGARDFEKEFSITTNSNEAIKLYNFNTHGTEYRIFYEGKKVEEKDSISLTALKPAVFKIRFDTMPRNQDSLHLTYTTSIDSMEIFKQGYIHFLFKGFIISRFPFTEKDYVVELSKSCLDSIRVYFPSGGTETGTRLYRSGNLKKMFRYIWYNWGDDKKSFITFYRKDIGRYLVQQASCWTADSFWLTIK